MPCRVCSTAFAAKKLPFPCVFSAFAANILPLPCVSPTAFAAKPVPLPFVFPLPSWLRHCLCVAVLQSCANDSSRFEQVAKRQRTIQTRPGGGPAGGGGGGGWARVSAGGFAAMAMVMAVIVFRGTGHRGTDPGHGGFALSPLPPHISQIIACLSLLLSFLFCLALPRCPHLTLLPALSAQQVVGSSASRRPWWFPRTGL